MSHPIAHMSAYAALERHSPLTAAELLAATESFAQRAESRYRRGSRIVHGLFFLAAAAGALAVLCGTDHRADALQPFLVILAALFGWGAYHVGHGNYPVTLRLKHWREEEGLEPLTAAEHAALTALASQVSEARAVLRRWEAMGTPLLARERDSLEVYLRACGVSVPEREADYFERLMAETA